MTDGKRMTLGELFAQEDAKARVEYARQLAWEATPEGKAYLAEQAAEYQRRAAANERYAAENPPDHRAEGAEAALRDEPREPPAALSEDDAELWLEGWDSEAPGDDE